MKVSTVIHPVRINFEIPISAEIKLPRFVYLFILAGEKIHFIDSGVASGVMQIKTFLEKLERKLSETQNIILTHSHPDHIGAAQLIQEKSKCKIIAAKGEQLWIEDTELQFKQRPVPGFHQLVAGPVKIDTVLNNGDKIELEENISIQVISTPGHSHGSTSFFLESENALFSGDAILLPGELPVFEDVDAYLNSLEKIKEINPEVLYSAWDEPRFNNDIQNIIEQSRNYILHIQKKVNIVASNFQNIQTLDFCKAVLKELGLNENIANPLLQKSFEACLK